jgi:uncharacterized protein YegP (UPF0339 family)
MGTIQVDQQNKGQYLFTLKANQVYAETVFLEQGY